MPNRSQTKSKAQTKQQLLNEVETLRARVRELEGALESRNGDPADSGAHPLPNQFPPSSLEHVLGNMVDGFSILDAQWRWSYVNDAAAQLAGRSQNELLGMVIWEEFPQAVGGFNHSQCIKTMEDRTPRSWTAQSVLGKWLEYRIFPWSDGIAVLTHDVTEQRQAQAALQRSAEQLRAAAIAAEIGMWHWTPGTSVVEVTANWRRLFGIAEDVTVTFESWSRALHPEDRERAVRELNAAADEHRDFATEYRVVRPDGSLRWMIDRGRASYDEAGRAVHMAGVNIDITDRKRAEDALRRREATLAQAGQMANLGAWDIELQNPEDVNANPLTWSDEVYRIFGYEPGQVRASNELFFERVHPDDRARVSDAVAQAMATRTPYSIEHRVIRPDGTERIVHEHGEVFFDAKDRPARIVGAVQDITERKQAEGQIQTLNRELQARAKELEGANEELHVANEELLVANEELEQEIIARRQVEESLRVATDALRVSEERFRFALAESPIFVANLDRHLCYTWLYNTASGYSVEEVLGKPFGMSMAPLAREKSVSLLLQVVHQGESHRWDTEGQTAKGPRYYETHAQPLRDAAGTIAGATLVSIDITERRLAEAERERLLAENQRRAAELDLVFESIAEGLLLYDATGKITYSNPAAEAMLNYSATHSLPTLDARSMLFTPEDESGNPVRVSELPLARALRGETVRNVVLKLYRSRWYRLSASPIYQNGELQGAVVAMADFTERKNAEQALNETMQQLRLSEERLRIALKNAPITVYNRDLDLNVTWAFNPWGLDSTDLRGKAAEQIIPLFEPRLEALKRQVIETGSGTRQEVQGTALDGREHYYDFNIDPLRDASGAIIGITCAAIDITEYKNAAKRIQQLNSELEQRAVELELANRELESFTYSVSHDLRTPLATIDSLAQMVESDYGDKLPDVRRHLELIRFGAEQMKELIESLLSLSRLSRHALKKQPIAMRALALQALETVHQEQSRANLTLDVRDMPDAEGDPVLLKQVWINLIANALKFTRKCDMARIEVGCGPCDGEERVYYVRDNGIGFNMDQADRLFGVFQRLHSEEDYEGHGVGLALVQRIIHRHGGRVWAEAEEDKGATFYFTLK